MLTVNYFVATRQHREGTGPKGDQTRGHLIEEPNKTAGVANKPQRQSYLRTIRCAKSAEDYV